jgi:hypothetical protein
MVGSPMAGGRPPVRRRARRGARARGAAVLERLARAAGADVSAAALAWLLHHPARVLPVVGTTDPGRIGTISQALAIPMDRQSWSRSTRRSWAARCREGCGLTVLNGPVAIAANAWRPPRFGGLDLPLQETWAVIRDELRSRS